MKKKKKPKVRYRLTIVLDAIRVPDDNVIIQRCVDFTRLATKPWRKDSPVYTRQVAV